MNHKRRKRRRGGIKGCCAMCSSQHRSGGLRNKRIRTRQEERAELKEREGQRVRIFDGKLADAY